MKGAFYPIKVILWWQAVLVFLLGCLPGLGVFILIIKTGFLPKSFEHGIGTGLLILSIFIVFSVAKAWFTVLLTMGITPAGLKLEYERGRLPFLPTDRLVHWERILSWETEHGHASAHSISPPIFKVKIENARSVYLFIADQDHVYKAFLEDFAKKIAELNAGKSAYFQIVKKPEFYRRRSTSIVMGSIFAVLLVLMNYAIWFYPDFISDASEKLIFSLIYSAFCIMMIVAMFINFKKGQKQSKPNLGK
jgi:hypothetical protein